MNKTGIIRLHIIIRLYFEIAVLVAEQMSLSKSEMCTLFSTVVRKCMELKATPSQPPNYVRLNSVSSYHKMKEKS
jgi:hypothetical protein